MKTRNGNYDGESTSIEEAPTRNSPRCEAMARPSPDLFYSVVLSLKCSSGFRIKNAKFPSIQFSIKFSAWCKLEILSVHKFDLKNPPWKTGNGCQARKPAISMSSKGGSEIKPIFVVWGRFRDLCNGSRHAHMARTTPPTKAKSLERQEKTSNTITYCNSAHKPAVGDIGTKTLIPFRPRHCRLGRYKGLGLGRLSGQTLNRNRPSEANTIEFLAAQELVTHKVGTVRPGRADTRYYVSAASPVFGCSREKRYEEVAAIPVSGCSNKRESLFLFFFLFRFLLFFFSKSGFTKVLCYSKQVLRKPGFTVCMACPAVSVRRDRAGEPCSSTAVRLKVGLCAGRCEPRPFDLPSGARKVSPYPAEKNENKGNVRSEPRSSQVGHPLRRTEYRQDQKGTRKIDGYPHRRNPSIRPVLFPSPSGPVAQTARVVQAGGSSTNRGPTNSTMQNNL